MPTDIAGVHRLVDELLRAHDPLSSEPTAFWGAQFDLGLAWVHFPMGLGGLGVQPMVQELVTERLDSVGAPKNGLINFVGMGTAGPALVAFGTAEQQRRFLRPMFTCDEVW